MPKRSDEFQKIVTYIMERLAPLGANVQDAIERPERGTGTLREIDTLVGPVDLPVLPFGTVILSARESRRNDADSDVRRGALKRRPVQQPYPSCPHNALGQHRYVLRAADQRLRYSSRPSAIVLGGNRRFRQPRMARTSASVGTGTLRLGPQPAFPCGLDCCVERFDLCAFRHCF